jgi:hypothetical protein
VGRLRREGGKLAASVSEEEANKERIRSSAAISV